MKIKKIIKSAYTILEESYLRTIGLMTTFLILIFFIGYVFSYLLGYVYIFYFFVVFGIILIFNSLSIGNKAVVSFTRAKEVKKEDLPEIYQIVENLAMTAGLPQTPKVYLIKSPALNAFGTGRNPKNSIVALTTGIIKALNKEEIEGVIAHEISCIKNKDIRVMTLATMLTGIMVIMIDTFVHLGIEIIKGKRGVLVLLIGILLEILAPIFAMLIIGAISRKRKFMADSSAALLTRNPEGLASALEKIASSNIPLEASLATTPLFIVNPFKKSGDFGKRWGIMFFYFHPPVEERIKLLRGMIIRSKKELNS